MNETKNTFNSMADRPLLITSIGCKWGFHSWQKWSNVVTIKDVIRTTSFQYRYCNSCNVYDWRSVSGQVPPRTA